MLRLSKKLMFAIEAVLDIAYNSGAQPVQSREINSRQGIPRAISSLCCSSLSRGILDGVRGPRGVPLARERRKITLAKSPRRSAAPSDVRSVRHPSGLAARQEIVRPLCVDLVATWTKELEKITIEDLCMRARETGIDSVAASTADSRSKQGSFCVRLAEAIPRRYILPTFVL